MRTYPFKIFVVLFFCLASPLVSQNDPSILNAKKAPVGEFFVGKVAGGGQLVNAIQTTDGSYVSISSTRGSTSYGDGKFIVRKATESGERIWETALSIEVPIDGYVVLDTIAQTNDGYVLVGNGTLGGYYGAGSGIVVALDSTGKIKWNKAFTPSQGSISFVSATSTTDGGFIVAGGAYPPAFHPIVLRFTSAGDVLWSKSFESLQGVFSSRKTSDNGLLLESDIWSDQSGPVGKNLIKIDNSGNIVWGRTLHINDLSSASVATTSENGLVLATNSSGSNTLSLICLNANGKIRWRANYSLSVPRFFISNLIQTPDGGFLVTGSTTTKAGAIIGGFFLKIDARRNLRFQKVFGVSGIYEEARSAFATKDDSYIVFGSSYGSTGPKHIIFLSLNSNGVVPGCSFVRHLNVKKVPLANVAIGTLTITSGIQSLPTPITIALKSAVSRKATTTLCQ